MTEQVKIFKEGDMVQIDTFGNLGVVMAMKSMDDGRYPRILLISHGRLLGVFLGTMTQGG